MADVASQVSNLIERDEDEITREWVDEQRAGLLRGGRMNEPELKRQSEYLLGLVRDAVRLPNYAETDVKILEGAQMVLTDLSTEWAERGLTPAQIARFVMSLKKPLFRRLREELRDDPAALSDETWKISTLVDSLALHITEVAQKAGEATIRRQQQELLELSTPVVRLWDQVLVLPLIGTLDSARTQVVMQSLLEQFASTGANIAIIDITGVPTVDTLVAQHLLRTVEAARLMGAECIVSGIRPQIAQTIVHLGVDLNLTTKATLADAFKYALSTQGLAVQALMPLP